MADKEKTRIDLNFFLRFNKLLTGGKSNTLLFCDAESSRGLPGLLFFFTDFQDCKPKSE
jgi:hypothetical protein